MSSSTGQAESPDLSPVTYSFEDEQAWQRLVYYLFRSYDLKDWKLLRAICAPKITFLETNVVPGEAGGQITADQFVSLISAVTLLGDPRLRTQHLTGNTFFEETSTDRATGNFQIQATHHRALPGGQQATWIANGYALIYYQRVHGEWRFAGIQPSKVQTQVGEESWVIGDFNALSSTNGSSSVNKQNKESKRATDSSEDVTPKKPRRG